MLREGGRAAVREAASTLGGVGIQHDLMTSAAAGIRAGAGAAKKEAVRHATAPSSERGW